MSSLPIMQATMHDARADSVDSDASRSSHTQSQVKRNKRFQACIACRATKTKCLPTDQKESCQACIRNNRPCIMPGPAKPRIKSAQKFSELEKKIEMLTNALAGRDHGLSGASDPPPGQLTSSNLQTPSASSNNSDSLENEAGNLRGEPDYSASLSPEVISTMERTQLNSLDEVLLDRESANSLFNHWRNNMRPFMPLISFHSDVDADNVRKSRPVTFLAILTVASASVYPPVAAQLVTRLTYELGRQVFVLSAQSVDLILAALLYSHYYFSTHSMTNLAPTQYIYAAVAMSSDLGLHSEAKAILSSSANKSASAIEAARVCLSEWFAASVTATQLHRKTLVRHTPDLEKFCKFFVKDQPSSDKWLPCIVRLQQIMEGASILLDATEVLSESAFDDSNTQYKMNMLSQQLENWQATAPADFDERLKTHAFHTAYLRIHMIAVRCFVRKVNAEKQSKTTTSSRTGNTMGLTPAHFECLTNCLNSIKTCLDTYLSIETPLARCLPNSYLFWNVSISMALVKLGHFGHTMAKLDPSQPAFEVTVIYYLDAIAARLYELSQDGYYPQAKPYITVFRKLRHYYLTKRAMCLNVQGQPTTIDDNGTNTNVPSRRGSSYNQVMPAYLNPSAGSSLPPHGMSNIHDDNIQQQQQHHQTPSSNTSLSHSPWTPSSAGFSQTSLQSQPLSNTYTDQFQNSDMGLYAAYDPSAYASEDWSMSMLDANAMQQLDSFMWADEDTAWMQSLL